MHRTTIPSSSARVSNYPRILSRPSEGLGSGFGITFIGATSAAFHRIEDHFAVPSVVSVASFGIAGTSPWEAVHDRRRSCVGKGTCMLTYLMTRRVVTQMRTCLNRRQLIGTGVGAILTVAVVGAMPATVLAQNEGQRVEGSWYITVNVDAPNAATFDLLYGFAAGGVFTRIDGRNNAAALGTWKYTEDGGIVFSNILFYFTPGDIPSPTSRNGAIVGKFAARVVDGTLTGTFTADGILGLSDFHRSGTFTGTLIPAEGP
jgi:hypothetical protein